MIKGVSEIVPCLPSVCGAVASTGRGMLALPMAGLDDEEGLRVDPGLPPVIDAHVHLFPEKVFEAIWRWFDAYGWPIRYKLHSPDVIAHLLARGVEQIVALCYAHKPGMARLLNRYMAELSKAEPRVTALSTVLPGEPDARAVLEEAFDLGLAGVKLHCHVQCFRVDDDAMGALYEACVARDLPMVIHAGREPKSDAYKCDPHALCHADRVARVLRDHPKLRLLVPHLGADEWAGYTKLLERYDNLWVDTTMMVGGFFDVTETAWRMIEARPDRVLYGTDFPNIPYAWDREIRHIAARRYDEEKLAALLAGNARRFFELSAPHAD